MRPLEQECFGVTKVSPDFGTLRKATRSADATRSI